MRFSVISYLNATCCNIYRKLADNQRAAIVTYIIVVCNISVTVEYLCDYLVVIFSEIHNACKVNKNHTVSADKVFNIRRDIICIMLTAIVRPASISRGNRDIPLYYLKCSELVGDIVVVSDIYLPVFNHCRDYVLCITGIGNSCICRNSKRMSVNKRIFTYGGKGCVAKRRSVINLFVICRF